MEEDGLIWWITFSFTSHGACVSLILGKRSTRMHYGKKASWQRQCDALGNVLLGNLGSCHSPCGCYFDMYHLPKNCRRPRTPFHGNCIPWWMWPLSAGWCAMPQSKNGSGMVWGTQPQYIQTFLNWNLYLLIPFLILSQYFFIPTQLQAATVVTTFGMSVLRVTN